MIRTISFLVSSTLACSAQTKVVNLEAVEFKLINTVAEQTTYKGRKSLKVAESVNRDPKSSALAILPLDFHNGVIEVDLAGTIGPGAIPTARGFVGVAFRVATDPLKFECFYLRPTNGRAPDQVRRNHSAQYISAPDFPWERLRKQEPEKYESYVDLVPGDWTKVKIVVDGVSAKLFVHGHEQPTLLVSDLKKGDSSGAVGLWIDIGTVAYFSNLRVTKQ